MLTVTAIHDLEEKVIVVCNSSATLEELQASGKPLWDWACEVLEKPLDELRHEIETHETDENFPTEYLEEKDHLLKLPLVLLEELNSHAR